MMLKSLISTTAALIGAALILASCAAAPAYVQKHHGIGGSSLVYVEEFRADNAQSVGSPVDPSAKELAARLRARLLTRLREEHMQTRDAEGSIPDDGLLVRGVIDTVDGGPAEGFSFNNQRLHCTVTLWNGRVSTRTPAFDIKMTGTPAAPIGTAAGILGAADDVADQIARFIRDNP